MGLEDSGDGNMMGLRVSSEHKCPKSFGEKGMVEAGSFDGFFEPSPRLKLDMGYLEGTVGTKKKYSPTADPRDSLKREILDLEKRLQGQVVVRRALEKALSCGAISVDEPSIPKPATGLIKEIAVLELEVAYLEQYLLSLYRKAFDQQVSPISPTVKEQKENSFVMTPRQPYVDDPAASSTSKIENASIFSRPRSLSNIWTERRSAEVQDKVLDSGVHRCHSSLSQRSTLLTRNSPMDSVSWEVLSCHSPPLSVMEYAHGATSNVITLAEHLGTNILHHVRETPNRISEDMVKCMSVIFYRLAEPPSKHIGLSSPNSSSPSMGGISPQYASDVWSPGIGMGLSLDSRLENPFNVKGLEEFSGPYSTMVEVSCIHRESQKLADVELMIQNFRSLVGRLEKIDPKKMKHEEKLAFWINVHNALVMHALLAYSIPQNNVKRVLQLLKASYNVGGHTISADAIQSSILGCRTSRPGQWLRALLLPSMKTKVRSEYQAYAIKTPEPLLHFALCLGNHSDPALRAYTPKRVSQELEAAKEEYIRATFGLSKEGKIVLPKLVESYMRDAGLGPAGLIEVIQNSLPEPLRKSLRKSRKNINWISHNHSFRFLVSKELLKVEH